MFVGHGLLAFALVAAGARWLGSDRRAALYAGLLAGLFATLPDLDILYGPVGLLGGVSGAFDAAAAFWETGNVVHRGPTHSLPVSAAVVAGVALWHAASAPIHAFGDVETTSRVRARQAVLGCLLIGGLAAAVALRSGGLAGVITAVYAAGGIGIALFARRLGRSPTTVLATGLVGTVTHPFGDLFTGEPPGFLYPLDATLVAERIVLHPDPTLHLLAAFAIELTTVWLALAVYFWLTEWRLREHIDRRALLGVGYGAAALLLPAPTLGTSYHFVFTVIAVGVVGLTPHSYWKLHWRRTAATGLATVTVAWAAYFAAHLAVG
ncbi:metal-dependent hydrolase [Halomicrobium urmianum]|uniref:metal-dependent hydrolase n=1 Tax=Halomicrobium urmianum TaxID=1586233 RepID=UPI001CD9E70E|nr:metal-dependent hydrolase [Halomicrobium urmianum]